jgi:hypothetical protein
VLHGGSPLGYQEYTSPELRSGSVMPATVMACRTVYPAPTHESPSNRAETYHKPSCNTRLGGMPSGAVMDEFAPSESGGSPLQRPDEPMKSWNLVRQNIRRLGTSMQQARDGFEFTSSRSAYPKDCYFLLSLSIL